MDLNRQTVNALTEVIAELRADIRDLKRPELLSQLNASGAAVRRGETREASRLVAYIISRLAGKDDAKSIIRRLNSLNKLIARAAKGDRLAPPEPPPEATSKSPRDPETPGPVAETVPKGGKAAPSPASRGK